VNVADNVEWAAVAASIAPQRLALDGRGIDLVGRAKHGDMPESFAVKPA
jgi:hypothetical protein